jgi:hypothetical protein
MIPGIFLIMVVIEAITAQKATISFEVMKVINDKDHTVKRSKCFILVIDNC